MNMEKKTKKDSHYARLRRNFRDNKKIPCKTEVADIKQILGRDLGNDQILIYGFHTVLAALNNPRRDIHFLLCTENSYKKLQNLSINIPQRKLHIITSKDLSRLAGEDAVHQGIAVICNILKLSEIPKLDNAKFVVLLDQITDPHNIGAIMRSCVAMSADSLITTIRHSPPQTSILAKSASGAMDMINYVTVRNLSDTIDKLHENGFITIGLDSCGSSDLVEILEEIRDQKIALILGSEGKGLRAKTREKSTYLARIDLPGEIKSLNVSNAAAIATYLVWRKLSK